MFVSDAPGSVAQFARDLSARFTARNFEDVYLARRCRTTVAVVRSWRAGVAVPTHAEWWYLERVAPEIADLGNLWRAIRAGDPTDDAPGLAAAGLTTVVESEPAAAAPAAPATQATRDDPTPADPVGDAAAQAVRRYLEPTPARSSGSRERVVLVPEGFVVYRCRITRGRILELPLPIDLSRADVDRLRAFLQTQADEDPGDSR